jgi:head-tail adaptor
MALNPLVINSGQLRHEIAIQQPNDTPDTRGLSAVPASWTTVRTTLAEIYTAGGRETSMASQIVADVSHVVKVRWTPVVIESGCQVVFGLRTFTVQYVENVYERNRVLLLYCREVNGGGQ